MNNTFILFEDRKAEIEFYYSIMLDIENNTGKIQTIDNSKFFRILKSNFSAYALQFGRSLCRKWDVGNL